VQIDRLASELVDVRSVSSKDESFSSYHVCKSISSTAMKEEKEEDRTSFSDMDVVKRRPCRVRSKRESARAVNAAAQYIFSASLSIFFNFSCGGALLKFPNNVALASSFL